MTIMIMSSDHCSPSCALAILAIGNFDEREMVDTLWTLTGKCGRKCSESWQCGRRPPNRATLPDASVGSTPQRASLYPYAGSSSNNYRQPANHDYPLHSLNYRRCTSTTAAKSDKDGI